MITLARRFYMDTEVGSTTPLPRAGTGMENPFVFDASAREIKALAAQGLVHIDTERTGAASGAVLITDLVFTRLR